MTKRIRINFVCLGNICRSPLGQGIFEKCADREGLLDFFEVDSSGTSGWHQGEPPHVESQRVARQNDIDISSQKSRPVHKSDFREFDYLLAMDTSNHSDLSAMAPKNSTAKIHCLREFDPKQDSLDVPDPFYGRADGFDYVFTMIERCCLEFLDHLREQNDFLK